MKINLAKSRGFCFGVKRALDIAIQTAGSTPGAYMLGDIVHNDDVVNSVKKLGIKKISRLLSGKDKILLIRAHGSCRRIIEKAKKLGYKIVDATCPMVKEIHKIAKEMEDKGCRIIVIGDRKHDEVHSIVGQLKGKAIVIDSIKNMPLEKIKKIDKACVVVQSTQNLEKVLKIVAVLKRNIKDLKFFNTICLPTRTKQEEIKTMPRENDVMIIIGSKQSANTRRLFEISKTLNKHSYWVSSKDEIKSNWFKDAKSAGITAGASTPDSTTQDVVKHIKQITSI